MYIESHTELRDHPKTKKLARLLGLNIRETIGLLHVFWWWVILYAPDGDTSPFTDEDIDDGCGWTGKKASLRGALTDCGTGGQPGFVDPDGKVHDWEEYGGKLWRRREANRERMCAARVKHVANTSQNVQSERREEKSRVEKSREEKIREEQPPPTPSLTISGRLGEWLGRCRVFRGVRAPYIRALLETYSEDRLLSLLHRAERAVIAQGLTLKKPEAWLDKFIENVERADVKAVGDRVPDDPNDIPVEERNSHFYEILNP
jgi:hypothetical protein